jgi:hypothetical protein
MQKGFTNDAMTVTILNQMGRLYEKSGQHEQAANALLRSLAMTPLQPIVIRNWVQLEQQRSKWPRFSDVFKHPNDHRLESLLTWNHEDKILDLLAEYASEIATIGFTQAAVGLLDKIIAASPDHLWAHIHRGFLRFRLEDFASGAKDIEYIYRNRVSPQFGLFATEDGTLRDLTGQTIVLSQDAGIGDLIQFVRYGALLKAQGAQVIVDCNPVFHTLLKGCEWIDMLCDPATMPSHFTHRVPMHNLIGAFQTKTSTIPAIGHYVRPTTEAVERWRNKRGHSGKKKIGISWRSVNENNATWTRYRSVPLDKLLTAFNPDQHELVCLQKVMSEDEHRLLEKYPYVSIPEGIFQDINETGAAISQLDAVVSSCTMLPHLSASIGIQTYLLLSTNPCWRWGLEGEKSAWYDALTLLRQNEMNQWDSVIESLRNSI